jgi:hypothetical protein
MLSEMEDGGHPILEHMEQVVGKLRQVLKHDSAQVWMRVDAGDTMRPCCSLQYAPALPYCYSPVSRPSCLIFHHPDWLHSRALRPPCCASRIATRR